jgi:eukaryotic-like serine/threonine-protein kinase
MLQPGTNVGGRYTIKALVGRGGMGAVYGAHDLRLGRDVALKVLREDLAADPGERARFVREGQIAAQIVHPNVVRTYDAGDDPIGPFLVQEFLSGQTLDQLGAVPPVRAAQIIRGIAAALAAIHSQGYVHCDIKPQNILLREQSGAPVLLDFGIARAEGAVATTLIATPHYLAPERAQGAPPTAASDLYALGIVLFQAVTGYPPFDAADVHGIIQQHAQQPVPPLGGSHPIIPVLDRVIARLTAKRPEDRYPSADAVQVDLAAVERNQAHAFPTVAVQPAPLAPALGARGSRHPAQTAPIQRLSTAWAAAPPWKRRRYLALIAVPLLLLLLGVSITRARRGAATGPEEPTVPAGVPTAATTSVPVPALLGLQYAAAEKLLADHGLVAQQGEVRPAEAAAGIVLASEPAPVSAVSPGSTVVLHTSAGPAGSEVALPVEQPQVVVPAEQVQPPVPAPAEEAPPADQGEDGDDDEDEDKQPGNGKGKGKGKKDN